MEAKEKGIDLTGYHQIGEIRNLRGTMARISNAMVLAVPIIGILLYAFVLHRSYDGLQHPWYVQLLIIVLLYPFNCVLHELLHGGVFKLFCPAGTVKFKWGLLGSVTSTAGSLYKWPFILMVLTPVLVLTIGYGCLAAFVPTCFAAFYVTALFGLASGSNDLLLAVPVIFRYRPGDVIADGDHTFLVYRKA
mgnify:CR=1 FL=1